MWNFYATKGLTRQDSKDTGYKAFRGIEVSSQVIISYLLIRCSKQPLVMSLLETWSLSSLFSPLVYTLQKATFLGTVRLTAHSSRPASRPPGDCISERTRTALPSTKPSGHPTTSLSSFLPKQQGNQDSSLSLHLLAPEWPARHPLLNVSTSLPLPSLPCLSTHTTRRPIWIRSSYGSFLAVSNVPQPGDCITEHTLPHSPTHTLLLPAPNPVDTSPRASFPSFSSSKATRTAH